MCEVNVTRSDKSTKDYHPDLQLSSDPSVLGCFSSLFWFILTTLINLVSQQMAVLTENTQINQMFSSAAGGENIEPKGK